jgi:hypothetical protein
MTTETRAPKTSWCWFCRRAINHDDYEARRVIGDTGDEWVCGPCWDKADVGPDVPLDMTEGEDDDD